MELVPFTEAHAVTVANWATSAAEAAMWSGQRDFPFPADRVAAWHRAADVRAHLLVRDGTPVGYGELWYDPDEDEAELARIIVAPDARGKGTGRELVRGLAARARHAGFRDIFLRVHPGNDRALRCYRGADFLPVDAAVAASWNTAQPVDYIWLRHATLPD